MQARYTAHTQLALSFPFPGPLRSEHALLYGGRGPDPASARQPRGDGRVVDRLRLGHTPHSRIERRRGAGVHGQRGQRCVVRALNSARWPGSAITALTRVLHQRCGRVGSAAEAGRGRGSTATAAGAGAGTGASAAATAADDDEEERSGLKLGLGDFVFYSVLVARAGTPPCSPSMPPTASMANPWRALRACLTPRSRFRLDHARRVHHLRALCTSHLLSAREKGVSRN